MSPLHASALTAALLAAACGGSPEPDSAAASAEPGEEAVIRITDDAGRLHQLAEPPSRIVSLVPSATEIILSLGEGGRLVARTDFDTASVLSSLRSVGGGLEPNMERLLSLSPDMVVRFHARADPETPRRLDRAGIPHLAVYPERIDDVRRMMRHLGTLLARSERAEERVRRMDRELEAVRSAVEGRPRPRVAYILGGNPPWVAGRETFIGELLALAGGENAFSDLPTPYAEVSLEALVARDVERILAPEGVALPAAVPEDRVVRVSPITRSPGPRLAEAARELAELLHPNAFR